MDDTEDDARYPQNHEQDFGSSNRQKLPVRNAPYSREEASRYVDDDDDDDDDEDENEEEEEEEEEDEDDMAEEDGDNINRNNGDDDVDDDNDNNEDVDNEDDDEDDSQKNLRIIDDEDSVRHPKKRKMKSLVSGYEFVPRVPITPSATKPSFVGRNPLTDWTEHETFVLLDAWGEKYLQRGRKSLRSEEWHEVAEKVSEVSKNERTDTQCRNRLDTLKKKYKKEKGSLSASKWVYFRKMDILLSPSGQQGGGLSCGVDSGEYVIMNPRVCLNRANGLDNKVKDSPENSGSDDSDGLPPKKRRSGRDRSDGCSIRVLAESIYKFSEIYEKIESSKRQQMLELEKMRMDFETELEMQKRAIMERAREEMAKVCRGDDEENENGRG